MRRRQRVQAAASAAVVALGGLTAATRPPGPRVRANLIPANVTPAPVDGETLVRDAQARASRAQRRHRLHVLHVLELRRAARLEQERRRAAELAAARARLASTGGIPAVWLALVRCEAGRFGWRYGAPDVGTDPGYDFEGGPNFTHGTWLAYRPSGFPDHAYDATPAQQVVVARLVLDAQGVDAWPECGPRVDLRRGD